MLGSIDIVAFVPTKDAEKARAFYEGVLGLRFVKDDGFALVLDANGIKVRVAKAQFTPAPFTILGWQVSDIKKVVTGLQGKGCSSRGLGFSSRTSLESGPRRVGTRWRGSRIPTGMFCRCHSMGNCIG
jgi:catechol 2,3-dioxygenase-like lactoylglutathione lyase family enzyme